MPRGRKGETFFEERRAARMAASGPPTARPRAYRPLDAVDPAAGKILA